MGVEYSYSHEKEVVMFLAKPNLNNTLHSKTFETKKEAVKYLEDVTGFKMDFEVDRKTKIKTYDWELVGKLIEVK